MPATGQIALHCVGHTRGLSVPEPEFRETIYVDLDRKTYCTASCPEVRSLEEATPARLTFRNYREERHPRRIDFAEFEFASKTYSAQYALQARAPINRRTSALCSITSDIPRLISEKLIAAADR